MTKWWKGVSWVVVAVLATACAPTDSEDGTISVDYERYELDNGLEVILHVDRSDAFFPPYALSCWESLHFKPSSFGC